MILKVSVPCEHPTAKCSEADWLDEHKVLIGFIWPAQNEALMQRLAGTGGTVLAMDCIPRISRAQNYDALSTMANIAGYRAVIEAGNTSDAFSPARSPRLARCPPPRSW